MLISRLPVFGEMQVDFAVNNMSPLVLSTDSNESLFDRSSGISTAATRPFRAVRVR